MPLPWNWMATSHWNKGKTVPQSKTGVLLSEDEKLNWAKTTPDVHFYFHINSLSIPVVYFLTKLQLMLLPKICATMSLIQVPHDIFQGLVQATKKFWAPHELMYFLLLENEDWVIHPVSFLTWAAGKLRAESFRLSYNLNYNFRFSNTTKSLLSSYDHWGISFWPCFKNRCLPFIEKYFKSMWISLLTNQKPAFSELYIRI